LTDYPQAPGHVGAEDVRGGAVCRSIKTLREPYAEVVTDADIEAAALQYIRKISGFRTPAAHNAAAFHAAVDAVAATTATLLDQLVIRGGSRPATAGDGGRRGQATARAGITESGAQRD
jgi:hypothetical protein